MTDRPVPRTVLAIRMRSTLDSQVSAVHGGHPGRRLSGKAARKIGIQDAELCGAVQELSEGKGDDLGGGVWKKRLNKNRSRSIVLTRRGAWWIFTFLFDKKDRANIDDAELMAFRKLSKDYAALKPAQLQKLVLESELLEICHGTKAI